MSTDLAERYGTEQPWRRTALVAVAAVLVLAFLGWLAWATWFHANPAVESQLSTYKIVDQHEATAVVDRLPRRRRGRLLPGARARPRTTAWWAR